MSSHFSVMNHNGIAMKIAAITVAFNEDYQLKNFKNYFTQYSGQLYRHIIVDNGSSLGYVTLLKQEFPQSTILTLSENGGTTAAFNSGIKYALEDPEVEGILLTVQDVKLDPMFLVNLSSLLSNFPDIAAAGGVVFSSGTKDQIESFGGIVDWNNFVLQPHFNCVSGTQELPDLLEVDFIPGGVSLIRREAFEKVGLQDERLFMYCDELDWIFRAQKCGYRAVVIKEALAWHNHVNYETKKQKQNLRQSRASFYTFRNRIYLTGKHHGRIKKLRYWAKSTYLFGKLFIRKLLINQTFDSILFAQILGVLYGVFSIMGPRLYINDRD